MNAPRTLVFLLVSSLLSQVSSLPSHAQGGPLAPPSTAGPEVGPTPPLDGSDNAQATMKTLHQVEPRVPISSLPFIISDPGSYYFTDNLTAPIDQTPIIINASNVTIDLNGFILAADPASTSGSGFTTGIGKRIKIHNGRVHGFPSTGISLQNGDHVHIEDVHVSDCTGLGIWVGSGAVLRRCLATGNSLGIFVRTNAGGDTYALVESCLADGNGLGFSAGPGTIITRCLARNNTGDGYSVASNASVIHCSSTMNGRYGFSDIAGGSLFLGNYAAGNTDAGILGGNVTRIESCYSTGNGSTGIRAGGRCTIVNSSAVDNLGNDGIQVGGRCALTGCASLNNVGIGIVAAAESVFENCSATGNSLDGILAGDTSRLARCHANLNGGDGIQAGSGCGIVECTVSTNGESGIECAFGCVVTDGAASGNTHDGFSATSGNVFSRCAAYDNTLEGFDLDDSNRVVDCTAKDNDDNGFSCDDRNNLTGCLSENNGIDAANAVADGIQASQFNTIRGCTCMGNAGDGIAITHNRNFIERNHCRANGDFGIDLSGDSNNVVILNFSGGNGGTGGGTINPDPGTTGTGDIAPISTSMSSLTHPLSNLD